MSLTAVGTHKSNKIGRAAITLSVNKREFELSHEASALLSDVQVKEALISLAGTADVQLPNVVIHRNRDDNLAILVGDLPKDFVWPEDEDKKEV